MLFELVLDGPYWRRNAQDDVGCRSSLEQAATRAKVRSLRAIIASGTGYRQYGNWRGFSCGTKKPAGIAEKSRRH